MEMISAGKEYSMISLDTTNHCNARCKFCFNEWGTANNMSEKTFLSSLSVLPLTQDGRFFFSCVFEPSLNPNFLRFLGLIPKRYRKKVLFTMNLVKKMSLAELEEIAISCVDYINISLETFDRNLYAELTNTKNSHFYENLDLFCKLINRKRQSPELRFITMILRSNYNELIEIAHKANAYHPSLHEFRVPYFFISKDNDKLESELLTRDEILAVEQELLKLGYPIVVSHDALDVLTYRKMLVEFQNDPEALRFKYGDDYTVRINSDGTGEFFGDGSTFSISEMESPFLFFSQKLIDLQKLEARKLAAEKTQFLFHTDSSVIYTIDTVTLYDERFLHIRGWIIYTGEESGINQNKKYLRFQFDNQEYLFKTENQPRPDVAEAYKSELYNMSGAYTIIDLDTITAEGEAVFSAQFVLEKFSGGGVCSNIFGEIQLRNFIRC